MSVSVASEQDVRVRLSGRVRLASRESALRALLIMGCTAFVAVAMGIGRPESQLRDDIELARLLRGMALIKASLVLAAASALWWRFGWPVSTRLACLYLAGAWVVAAASMLIWELKLIGFAALAFHAGALALLVAAWRDRAPTQRRNRISAIASAASCIASEGSGSPVTSTVIAPGR